MHLLQKLLGQKKLTTAQLLDGYARGRFPMAQHYDSTRVYWHSPRQRGIIPIETFHVPHGLRSELRKSSFSITVDQAFEEVIRGCAERTDQKHRDDTWINNTIIDAYTNLHKQGKAHSIEVWDKRGSLVGGLYGVSIGGAFFGESMFSRVSGASKTALVHLANILKDAGYTLLDTQYVNDHLKQFGGTEIPQVAYKEKLSMALVLDPNPSDLFSNVAQRYCERLDSAHKKAVAII